MIYQVQLEHIDSSDNHIIIYPVNRSKDVKIGNINPSESRTMIGENDEETLDETLSYIKKYLTDFRDSAYKNVIGTEAELEKADNTSVVSADLIAKIYDTSNAALPKAGGTMSGDIAMDDNALTFTSTYSANKSVMGISGEEFNAKIKQLVKANANVDATDTLITAITFTTIRPSGTPIMTIDDVNGNYPISVYLEVSSNINDPNKKYTVILYTEANKIVLPENASRMFAGFQSITTLDLSMFDTSKVTNMYGFFRYAKNLQSLDLSNFDTSKVTNMSNMFYYCSNLNTLYVNFDTSKVTDMSYMFGCASSIGTVDLTTFGTSSVANITYMFYNCGSLSKVLVSSSWNISSATGNTGIFSASPITSVTVTNDLRNIYVEPSIGDKKSVRIYGDIGLDAVPYLYMSQILPADGNCSLGNHNRPWKSIYVNNIYGINSISLNNLADTTGDLPQLGTSRVQTGASTYTTAFNINRSIIPTNPSVDLGDPSNPLYAISAQHLTNLKSITMNADNGKSIGISASSTAYGNSSYTTKLDISGLNNIYYTGSIGDNNNRVESLYTKYIYSSSSVDTSILNAEHFCTNTPSGSAKIIETDSTNNTKIIYHSSSEKYTNAVKFGVNQQNRSLATVIQGDDINLLVNSSGSNYDHYIVANRTLYTRSDKKDKNFTEDLSNDTEKLLKLVDMLETKSYRYRYASDNSALSIGFAASDVEDACLKLGLDPHKYAFLTIKYNDYCARGDEEDYKYYIKSYHISYSELHTLQFLRIQQMEKEHQEKLAELEEKNKNLESSLGHLTDLVNELLEK